MQNNGIVMFLNDTVTGLAPVWIETEGNSPVFGVWKVTGLAPVWIETIMR